SEAMKARVLDQFGSSVTMLMGCYGIGVSRIVAAAIEQNHDERGIIWPDAIAPFECAIAPINMHKSERLREAAEALYAELAAAGVDVLFHDGRERPGVMFADLDLVGVPHRFVLSDRGLDAGTLEYKSRTAEASEELPRAEAVAFLRARLGRA
ncbi:MAG: His/Gly/Thr/Pro-type tRNA ligase C-terminal domain-containing protein, partial [Gammaproteobacteria bacterium]